MAKSIYYLGKTGELYSREQVQRAFEICTGMAADNKPAFLKWLWGLFGKSIERVVVDPTVEDLINFDHRVWAIKLYRDQHNCGLAEAKAAIDAEYPIIRWACP